MIDGNTAAGLGCVYAGATVGAWYPDHAVDLADGRVQGLLRALPRRSRRPARRNFAVSAGGGRTGRGRHGAGRLVERRARVHAHQRAGHFADERIRGPGLLRRSALRDFRRAAGRAVDRHADAHAAIRHPAVRLRLARRYAARAAVSGESRGMLLHGGAGVRSRRASADAGVRAVGSRHRHERLDVPGPAMGRRLPSRPRQGAAPPRNSPAWTSSTATSTATTMRFRTARCRGRAPRARISPAARATTSMARTPRTRPNTRWCSTGSKRKFANAAKYLPKPVVIGQGRQRSRHRQHRQLRRRDSRGARCARAAEDRSRLSARQGISRSTTRSRRS